MVDPNPSDLPPRVAEKRRTARRRTLLAGKAIYGGGWFERDCTIRNFSAEGAKITLARGDCVPTRFFLMVRRNATAYEARVTWIRAPDFGLAFVRAFDLNGEIPAELGFLNLVWADFRLPRAGARSARG
jgi:hypothetical protein